MSEKICVVELNQTLNFNPTEDDLSFINELMERIADKLQDTYYDSSGHIKRVRFKTWINAPEFILENENTETKTLKDMDEC